MDVKVVEDERRSFSRSDLEVTIVKNLVRRVSVTGRCLTHRRAFPGHLL